VFVIGSTPWPCTVRPLLPLLLLTVTLGRKDEIPTTLRVAQLMLLLLLLLLLLSASALRQDDESQFLCLCRWRALSGRGVSYNSAPRTAAAAAAAAAAVAAAVVLRLVAKGYV